jgi:hypothetical protein
MDLMHPMYMPGTRSLSRVSQGTAIVHVHNCSVTGRCLKHAFYEIGQSDQDRGVSHNIYDIRCCLKALALEEVYARHSLR